MTIKRGSKMKNIVTKEQAFIADLVNQFQDFVMDSMQDGMHEEFDDHYKFLKAAMKTFCNIHEDMNDLATTGQAVRPFGQ